MKKCNKIKHTCSEKNYATCIYYELELPEFSELGECVTLEETTDELYDLVGEIKEDIDLTLLGNNCLTYSDKKPKTVILELESQICDLKDRVTELENRQLCDMPISACGINLSCLSIPCEQEILTMADLFNAIIIRLCD